MTSVSCIINEEDIQDTVPAAAFNRIFAVVFVVCDELHNDVVVNNVEAMSLP